jgi:arylsulfatase A-like enzyme
MIDDMGWMDLACQGNPLVDTPNIDRLARQGMRFTDAYAAAPVCSPTRAAILTGLSPARLHITNHTPDQKRFTPDNPKLLPAPMHNELSLDYVTIAERLQASGYRTAFMGKWHLSGPNRGNPELEPTAQGFELNIGGAGYGGPPSFWDPYNNPTIEDRRPGEYLPDRLADEAIHYFSQRSERPFMLFLWNYTVHWPMEAPAALLEKYRTRTGPGLNDTRYGAMIEALDHAVGRILSELDRQGLSGNTLVIFTSDNGGFGGVADNRPLREEKGYLYEGGIRIPLIVRWPGRIEAGSVSHEPVISMDHYATLLDVAGLEADPDLPLEGVSLLPHLTEKRPLERDALFFHYPNYAFHRGNRLGSAIRMGDYQLIESFDDDSVELYNLSVDLGERNDLAATEPERAAELRGRLAAWRQKVNANMPVPVH